MRSLIATVASASLLALALVASPSHSAEEGYYKWMDERGRPFHSDRPPPPGIAYEFVSNDGGLRRQVSAEESQAAAAQQEEQAAPSEPVSEEEGAVVKNSAYCDQAKANLDTLNSKARVRIRDADGNIRFLTEEEKEAQRTKARDLIDIHCG